MFLKQKAPFILTYNNEERMHELLVSCQQPLAKDLAQNMSIKIIGYKYARKEVGTIYT